MQEGRIGYKEFTKQKEVFCCYGIISLSDLCLVHRIDSYFDFISLFDFQVRRMCGKEKIKLISVVTRKVLDLFYF